MPCPKRLHVCVVPFIIYYPFFTYYLVFFNNYLLFTSYSSCYYTMTYYVLCGICDLFLNIYCASRRAHYHVFVPGARWQSGVGGTPLSAMAKRSATASGVAAFMHDLPAWGAARHEFTKDELIGRGSFGTAWRAFGTGRVLGPVCLKYSSYEKSDAATKRSKVSHAPAKSNATQGRGGPTKATHIAVGTARQDNIAAEIRMLRLFSREKASKEHITQLLHAFHHDEGKRVICVLELGVTSLAAMFRTVPCFMVPLKLGRAWMTDMLGAAAYIHDIRVLHRDIKPANVILHLPPDGCNRSLVAKLCDFGCACFAAEVPDDLGWPVTTYQYSAPEILNGSGDRPRPQVYSAASDIWSLGVILVEMLSDDATQCAVLAADKADNPQSFCFGISAMKSRLANAISMRHASDQLLSDGKTNPETLGMQLADTMLAMEHTSRPMATTAQAHPFYISHLNPVETLVETAPLGQESVTDHGTEAPKGFQKSHQDAAVALARAFCLFQGVCGLRGIQWLGPYLLTRREALYGPLKDLVLHMFEHYKAFSCPQQGDPLWAGYGPGQLHILSGGAFLDALLSTEGLAGLETTVKALTPLVGDMLKVDLPATQVTDTRGVTPLPDSDVQKMLGPTTGPTDQPLPPESIIRVLAHRGFSTQLFPGRVPEWVDMFHYLRLLAAEILRDTSIGSNEVHQHRVKLLGKELLEHMGAITRGWQHLDTTGAITAAWEHGMGTDHGPTKQHKEHQLAQAADYNAMRMLQSLLVWGVMEAFLMLGLLRTAYCSMCT